ncbi:MAG TPA: metallopeptidase family protein [Verrucomicrobiae bacterium]|nr:metallopeptidase family protein [Verrucomicrobiae bacterium]
MPAGNWAQLETRARREVDRVIRSLPKPLREKARKLPVTYERQPNDALVADGIEVDTLGLFVGPAYAEEGHGSPMPSQIILYLDNIWDQADEDIQFFAEEVRATFLHELGHYLGLDEEGLFDRGLD